MLRNTVIVLALATVALSGCTGSAEANSNLYVKDALTDDVAEVHVTFTKAQVKAADNGWTTVFDGKMTIDLLALSAADAKEQLAAFSIPAGNYDGLRIAVSEVMVIDHDGQERLLNTFGNIVQVAEDFTVGADGIDILVDFDLEQGVDLEAGTYTPVVKDVQTSDDDADGDGENDVDDIDDDNDGNDDANDDDDDGDGEDDEPRQFYADSAADACAAEREEELAEAQEELDEDLAEAEAERDEAYAEAEAEREDTLTNASASPEDKLNAQSDYENATAEADAEYEEDVAEAHAEYDEEVAEIEDEQDECLDDDDDDDDDEDEDEEDEDEDEESDDSDDESDGRDD